MTAASLEIENGAVRLSGDLTFATVTDLYERMQSTSADSGMPKSIDLAGVGRIDSAGLALLLEWQSTYRKKNRTSDLIEIGNPPSALLKIARLCDAEEFLGDAPQARKNNE